MAAASPPACTRPASLLLGPPRQTPEVKALLRRRSKVERKIDHLQDLGMDGARYRGRRKTKLQALLAATVANMQRLHVLGVFDITSELPCAA